MKFRISDLKSQIAHLKFGISNRKRFVLVSALVLAALAAPAFAAISPSDTAVVGKADSEFYDSYIDRGFQTFPTIKAAFEAFALPSATFKRVLLLKGTWQYDGTPPLPTPLESIEGASPTKPYEVIIEGTAMGATSPPVLLVSSKGTSEKRFRVSRVSIQKGSDGIRVQGEAFVDLESCYIHDNFSHGLTVTDNAEVKATNCIFFMNQDGVHVEDATDAPKATIIHCTAISNHGHGLCAGQKATVSATNCLFSANSSASSDSYGVYKDAAASSVTLSSNNSFNNFNNRDYAPEGVEAANNWWDFVKFLLDPSFQGELDPSNLGIPADSLHRGVSTEVGSDFEGDRRSGTDPWIGADEISLGSEVGYWSACDVTSAPIGTRGAYVEIYYTGEIAGLYLVPQGVPDTESASHFQVPLEGGDGFYWGTIKNNEISTFKNGRIVDGDGHFIIVTDPDGIILGRGGPDDALHISSAAEAGRRVLVDTIPPEVVSVLYQPQSLVTELNNMAATAVPFGSPVFPYSNEGIGAWWQWVAPSDSASRAVFAPYDGLFPLTEGPKFVYNVGSVANGYNIGGSYGLNLTITGYFIDKNVYEKYPELDNSSTEVRRPSGFPDVGSETGAFSKYFTELWKPSGLPAAWLLQNLNGITAETSFTPALTAGNNLVANWSVIVPVVVNEMQLFDGSLDLLGDFVSQDLAGNSYPEASSPLPPLQVSWRSGSNLKIQISKQMYGSWPEVSWGLNISNLNISKQNPANPRPIYSFNIWGALSDNPMEPNYKELTGWSPWSTQTVLPASFFDQNTGDNFGEPITDRSLIIVVAGCDEAGNVTPWDGYGGEVQTLFLDGNLLTLADVNKDSGRNWLRFRIPGKSAQLDTVLYANLYYVNPDTNERVDFGPAPIVSFPPPGVRLMAEFNARILLNDPALWGSAWLKVTCQQNGISVFGFSPGYIYMPTSGTDMVYFELPYEGAPPQLGDASNVMTYTISAAALADTGADPLPEDQTPATFSFKVVPGSVDDYLRSSGGQQPVKQFETR